MKYVLFLLLLVLPGCCNNGSEVGKSVGSVKERTYGMIKPHAVKAGVVGEIMKRIKEEGFTVVTEKAMQMTKELAATFYAVHKGKPFFDDLVESMSSGPIVVFVLEKENAITAWRDLMGATNPENAAPNTLRKLYGVSVGENAVHGSDASETAEAEIKLIFPEL